MPPNNWINFTELRKRITLEDVLLRFYRLENLKRDGQKLIGPCPVHQGKSPRSFHADLDKNVWHCFTKCQGGGNQLDLVAKKEDISIRDAALKLQAFFQTEQTTAPATTPAPKAARIAPPTTAPPATTIPPSPATPPQEPIKENDTAENPPLNVKLDLKADHPHLTDDRKLKVETTQHFGVGYCARGIFRGMIAIPIHDDEGTLVAYAGRRLKPVDIREHGKYKLPKGFRKELVLYNFHRAKEYQKEQGLILVEGFFSTLKLYEAGFRNVVAPMGCELSDQQARLCAEAKEVIILFDGNDAGYKGMTTAKAKLTPYVPVRVVKLAVGTEPESFSPKALRWLIDGVQCLDLSEVSFVARAVSTPLAATSADPHCSV